MQSRLFRIIAMALALGLAVTVAATAGGNREESQEDQQSQEQQQDQADQADSEQSQPSGNAQPAQPGSEPAVDPDGEPVAVVNGSALSNERFNDAVARNEMQMRRQSQGAPISETQLNDMKSNILEGMINEELLYQEAQQQGISASESEVEQQIQQYKGQYGEEGFASALANAGMNEEQLRSEISRSLTIQNLLEEEVTSGIDVTDEEVREFYEENTQMFEESQSVKASHILIDTRDAETEEAKEEARARAEDLLEQLEGGADFAELAREYSEGPSAQNGGSLPQFSRGEMVPPFEEAAFALEAGEISDVVETRFGFHIIRVEEKSEGGATPYEEVEPQIAQYLEQQKQQEAVQTYLDELKEAPENEIERNVEFG
ncbi:MAG: peptidylprolyl isomerase [Spirochaetes bacterium]|nr:peptidylprolyl isomerase [Spirochaetota bacterium]